MLYDAGLPSAVILFSTLHARSASAPDSACSTPEGNIWTIDGQGNQIKKWSPDASELLMTLGEYDVAGDDGEHFNRPTDVAFGPNGDFYISDGYVNTRVAKFAADGRFIKAWGDPGSEGPGQFNTVHSVIIDRRDRVLVADRNNAREVVRLACDAGDDHQRFAEVGLGIARRMRQRHEHLLPARSPPSWTSTG